MRDELAEAVARDRAGVALQERAPPRLRGVGEPGGRPREHAVERQPAREWSGAVLAAQRMEELHAREPAGVALAVRAQPRGERAHRGLVRARAEGGVREVERARLQPERVAVPRAVGRSGGALGDQRGELLAVEQRRPRLAGEPRDRDCALVAREPVGVVGRGVVRARLSLGSELDAVEAERAHALEQALRAERARRAAAEILVGLAGEARVVDPEHEALDVERGARLAERGARDARLAQPPPPRSPLNRTTASGGSVIASDCACPCAAMGVVRVPPRFPCPLPP
jgi:hypothetical protein